MSFAATESDIWIFFYIANNTDEFVNHIVGSYGHILFQIIFLHV